MRVEDSQIMIHLEGILSFKEYSEFKLTPPFSLALTDKHFKEMAELTARHSANSRKLIAENTAIRMTTDIRHTKQKGILEGKGWEGEKRREKRVKGKRGVKGTMFPLNTIFTPYYRRV